MLFRAPGHSAQWLLGTVKVISEGQPLVITSGVSVCAPTGTPLRYDVSRDDRHRNLIYASTSRAGWAAIATRIECDFTSGTSCLYESE